MEKARRSLFTAETSRTLRKTEKLSSSRRRGAKRRRRTDLLTMSKDRETWSIQHFLSLRSLAVSFALRTMLREHIGSGETVPVPSRPRGT